MRVFPPFLLCGTCSALQVPTDRRSVLALASLVAVPASLAPAPSSAEDGAKLFEASCTACHAGGGNVVARGKTLDRAALLANGYDVDGIAAIVRDGRKQMPGYGETCSPKPACTFGPRLSEESIRAVAAFVDARADDGKW